MRDYRKAEARQRRREAPTLGQVLGTEPRPEDAADALYAGLLRVERGPAAFRITFPAMKDRYRDSRPILAAVKSLPGRRYDPFVKSWSVPIEHAEAVEAIAREYGAEVEELALAAGFDADAAATIARLERELRERELYIEGLEQELQQHQGCGAVAA